MEIQFAKKKEFLEDNQIQFKDSATEQSIKEALSEIEGNPYLMIKCEKLDSPLIVIDAVPVTEDLLKRKLTL